MTKKKTLKKRDGNSRRQRLEKNIPTKQHLTEENARIQASNENKIGSIDIEAKTGQGKKAPGRLSDRELDLRFPGSARLRARSDYIRVQKKGKMIKGCFLILLSLENGLTTSRFGLTVSGKLGNAVKRNRIRRRIREIERFHRHRIKSGFDIVVIARNRARDAGFDEMKEEYLELARNASLTTEESGN